MTTERSASHSLARLRAELPPLPVLGRAWVAALRPFSFSIAAVSCGLGIALAALDRVVVVWQAALVLAAGLLLQAGVNLVNDFFEFKTDRLDNKQAALGVFGAGRSAVEWSIYLGGLACFAGAGLLALPLVVAVGRPLLWLVLLGFVGAYFYTGEPLNYKRRGLAVTLVFLLMGVVMIAGSYYAASGTLSPRVVWLSVPVSALVSLLLLSNELRDFEDDARHGIGTLTVRIGYAWGVRLYVALVALAYGATLLVWWRGLLPFPWPVALSLPALAAPLRHLHSPRGTRRPLTPLTARFHLVFGLCFILACLAGEGLRALGWIAAR